MAYTKTTWNEGIAPGISADNLNNLETQYDEAVDYTDAQIAGIAGVPSGAILMWSGLLSAIPSGYALCDGNNGTPNLLDRFILGVPNAQTNPGGTGGATSKTTAGHVHTGPAHTHTGPSHTHTGPSHTHTQGPTATPNEGTTYQGTAIPGPAIWAHTHNNPPTDAGGTGATGASGTGATGSSGTGDTGSKTDSIADIRPKYFILAFIQKL